MDIETIAATSGITTAAVGIMILPVYRFMRKFDNLCSLHVRNHPEDASLLGQSTPASAREFKKHN